MGEIGEVTRAEAGEKAHTPDSWVGRRDLVGRLGEGRKNREKRTGWRGPGGEGESESKTGGESVRVREG